MVGKEKTQQQKLALDHSFIQLVVTDNLLSGSPEPCILKSGRANTFPPKWRVNEWLSSHLPKPHTNQGAKHGLKPEVRGSTKKLTPVHVRRKMKVLVNYICI